jgi:hypothetical protein
LQDLGLKTFNKLYPMMIKKYQDLIVDQNASEKDKINQIIQKLNALGKLSNDVVRDLNTVYQWAMNEGLTQNVVDKINQMFADGSFNEIIDGYSTQITNEFNTQLDATNQNIQQAATDAQTQIDLINQNQVVKQSDYNTFVSQTTTSLAQQTAQAYDNKALVKGIQAPFYNSGAVAGWIDDDCPVGFTTTLQPLCDKYNFKVGLACITGLVGDAQHMTTQQLLTLQNSGHEVYSHSATHNSALWYAGNLINADSTTLTNEMRQSQQWLKDNGFTYWDTFVYPGGGYAGTGTTGSEATKAKNLCKQFYRYGIDSTHDWSSFPIDPFLVPRITVQAGKTFSTDIQPKIDAAISANAMFIIMTHSGGGYFDSALTEQVIQYIQSKNISIVSGRQALELKSNAIAIGDVASRTHNKFVVGKDGSVLLPVKNLDGESPVTNSLDFTSPLTAFPSYCESRLFCRSTSDTLTGEGGILSTFYSWVGSYYNKQEFVSSGTFKKYIRSWNESTSTWNAWTSTTVTPQIVVNATDSVSITTGGTTTYASNVLTITPYSDSYASANGLPTGGSGLVYTYRYTGQTTIQEYRGNYAQNSDYTWVRHWTGSAWTNWLRRGGGYGATNARPTSATAGYMYFDSDLNKPIWRNKTNDGWVDATGTAV